MRRGNATTLQDIAREAGVTAMAASVVLNGATSSTRVSPATRERIIAAAERLRYRRNAVAHGLSRSRMDTIGVAAVDHGGALNLYFLEVLNGILEAAAENEQNTTVVSLPNWGDETRILKCLDGRVDGIVLLAPTRLTVDFAATLRRQTPYVTIHSNDTPPYVHNLDVDNEDGAYRIVRYLIEQGHQSIAHFTGGQGLRGADGRLAGYRRALTEAGIATCDDLILPGHFTEHSGRTRAADLLSRDRSALPTAIFCASDAIAAGCMEVLSGAGLRIPDDISIVGFDDVLTARMTTPPLTTVRQPFRQMGHRAVGLLLAQIRAEASEESLPPEVLFPLELVVRASVGKPRTHPLLF
jgi:LacI family transcriptional regulator